MEPTASFVKPENSAQLEWARAYRQSAASAAPGRVRSGDLFRYFVQNKSGPGIWKWRHYSLIYERHFAKTRGTEVHLLEIGVYSGDSLAMWRIFGAALHANRTPSW